MNTEKLELTNIEIKDDFPLNISFNGKSSSLKTVNLVDREADNCIITEISETELKPSTDKKKIIDVLKYFFSVCDVGLSPQCMWRTDNCDYESLMLEFEPNNKEKFEEILEKMIEFFPELKEEKNFLDGMPKGKTLLDVIYIIEVAYPTTWTVEFIRK